MRSGVVIFFALLFGTRALGQAGGERRYTEVPSGPLRIQAYLYVPDGPGRFPVVIYNHGSRNGRERESVPFRNIGRSLTRAGYAVLVPERRGYGKSDGAVWWQETGGDAAALITRLEAETDDVLAALEFLRTVAAADAARVGIMGWSFGGIVTMLAASRSGAFAAAVDQAGGAQTWDRNPHVRAAIIAAAGKSATPTLFMVAQNDRTTASVTTPAGIFGKRGVPHRLVVYEPFALPGHAGAEAAGHALFSAQGMSRWENDVVQFLDLHLKREKP